MAKSSTRTIQRKRQYKTRRQIMGINNDNTNMAWIPEPLGVKTPKDQHGRYAIQQKEIEREILLKQTSTLYNNTERYNKQDKQYFKELLEHCDQATNKNIKEWLVMAK
jgi:hypothetical protein